MGSRVAGKIKLQSVDELLGVPEIAGTQEIELGRIHSFPNHPFKVLDDEKMDTLVESIRENGILNPVIVRPDQNGDYEMISGHRRLHAAGIVGLKKVPAIVKEMSDDEAIIKMVDANIQREEILPSERAFSFKMKMEAMKRRGYRSDLDSNEDGNGTTSGTEFPKSDKWSRDIVGSEAGMTGRQVTKYIRLTELIPEILDYVDLKRITIAMAVDLSFLDEQVQKWVYEYYRENGFLKPVQVEALKNYPNLSNANQFSVISIMNDALPKKNTVAKVSLSEKKLDKYFPPHFSAKERENVIIQLLEQWSAEQKQAE
ncbi:MAG: ParB/RepB/Spo0J family partition protein [Agathobacter sp.]|nr:ParB/RepB/Spo0J family partition protein [Agathobacter sp.]